MIGEMPTKRTRLSVLKLKPNVRYHAALACDDVFSLHTHWLGKRSYACPGDECPACDQSIGAKWNGLLYVALRAEGTTNDVYGLLELTEAAYYRLRDFAEMTGQTIGPNLRCLVGRRSRRSPLSFQAVEDPEMVPEPSKTASMRYIAAGVSTLYGLPGLEPNETVTRWAERTKTAARMLLANQLRNLF